MENRADSFSCLMYSLLGVLFRTMKIGLMLSFIMFLALPTTAGADEFCDEAREFETQWNADLPKKIDEHTELIQIRVNCDTQVFLYDKRILVSGDKLPAGIHERKQHQYTQMNCNERGLASWSGWTSMDVIKDVNYQYLFTLKTRPEDCLR